MTPTTAGSTSTASGDRKKNRSNTSKSDPRKTTSHGSRKQNKTSKRTGDDTKAFSELEDDPEYWDFVQRKEEEVSQWLREHRGTLPDRITIMRLDYDLLNAVLTRERIRLVNHLREHGPYESLQQLADELGRDKTAVSRDLSYLDRTLVEVEKVGRRKRISAPRKPILLL